MSSIRYPTMGVGVIEYANFAAFPASAANGQLAMALDTHNIYAFDTGSNSWVEVAGPSSALSLGNLDAQPATAQGAALVGGVLSMQSADVTHPGLVNTAAQSFAGNKTFTGTISASNLSGTNTGDVTLGTANGLSLTGQQLSLGLSSTSTTGALSSTDWNTFNSKFNLPSLTAGSVLFSDGSTIAQDNANFFWDDTLNALKIQSAIQLGTQDAFSRNQIWNFLPNSILRLGSLASDGDATTVSSEGIVSYGANLQGDPMSGTNFAYARVKPLRFGLYNSQSAVAEYIFKVDPTSLYLTDNSFVKTFEVNRVTGQIDTSLSTGIVHSDASGILTSSAVNLASADVSGVLPVANGGTGQSSYTDGQLLIGNTVGNTLAKSTLTAGSGVTITNGNGSITISATGSGGTVTNVTASSPLASSGGATPNISLTGVVAIANGGTNSSTTLNNNRVMKSSGGSIVEAAAITGNRALASDVNGIPVASATTDTELGFVSGVTSSIQTQLNGKQATGNYITALTGDVTASGPGSAAATLATVNANVGSFGSSTAIPNFTVNAKGLITAAGTNAVIAPAGTLTGTTLASNVVSSSLTSVGTITSGTWNGTTIAIANGGTGQTSKAAAFDALSPMTTGGDIIYGGASGTGTRLANGSSGQVLTSNGGTSAPSWQTPSSGVVGVSVDGTWTGTQSIAHNTATTLSISGISFTTLTNFTNASGVLTCTTAGTYLVSGQWQMAWANDSSVQRWVQLNIRKNSTEQIRNGQATAGGAHNTYENQDTGIQTSKILVLAINDTIDFQAYQSNSGGNAYNATKVSINIIRLA